MSRRVIRLGDGVNILFSLIRIVIRLGDGVNILFSPIRML